MSEYTITPNTQFNSVEIAFAGKPSEAVRDALKALKFRWHSVRRVWYGFQTAEAVRAAIETAEGVRPSSPAEAVKKTAAKAEKVNKYGVKVGDIFSASWGYEQTNVDFFQVVALAGEYSVRVREVCPEIVEAEEIGPMAEYRVYKMTRELLPPASRSIFIKDQEKGDLKRVKPGFDKDPEKAKEHCYITIDSVATAFKCNGETEKTYESWYY